MTMGYKQALWLVLLLGYATSALAQEKQAYFGDLHIHTMYSMDAFMRNVRTTPDDAYRYAKGEPIPHPNGGVIRLGGPPLDFLAVSDHAEFLGVHASFLQEGSRNFDHDIKDYLVKPFETEFEFQTKMRNLRQIVQDDPAIAHPSVIRDAWTRTVDIANRHNQPGNFTAFIGYEFTSTTGGQHLHRNVIFRGANAPPKPFSSRDSANPQDLWNWLDDLRERGIEGLAIPHNMNQSNGLAFPKQTWRSEVMSAEFAEQRMRNEPIVELTQIKGTSETHPSLSTNDEWADFQIVQYYLDKVNNKDPISIFEGSYARGALLEGIRLKSTEGFNPHAFGFVGSSDGHESGAPYDEDGYFSKKGYTPRVRGSAYPTDRSSWQDVFTPREASHGPGGLAGVWAHENTREALFDAMRRKETFATSGPRIRARLFASFDFPEDLTDLDDPIKTATEYGVPMGGTLGAVRRSKSPTFAFSAVRDPRSTWLERVQIIKGWIENGEAKEFVYDVACANGKTPDKDTHRCPEPETTVNLDDCSVSKEAGNVSFLSTWSDPEFDPAAHAFYYLRVLEVPTCRWSTWDAVRLGIEPNPALQATQQDRAWTSPIWYDPLKAS